MLSTPPESSSTNWFSQRLPRRLHCLKDECKCRTIVRLGDYAEVAMEDVPKVGHGRFGRAVELADVFGPVQEHKGCRQDRPTVARVAPQPGGESGRDGGTEIATRFQDAPDFVEGGEESGGVALLAQMLQHF